MPRKKTEWSPTVERKFAALVRKGLTAGEVAAQLAADGVPSASPATVGRRMRELRGQVRATKLVPKADTPAAPVASEPVETVLADVPEDDAEIGDAPMAQIDRWLDRVDAAWASAERDGNLAAQASLAARATALLEAKRKGSPPPVQDPNDAPDLIAAAEQARARIVRKLEQAISKRTRGAA